MARETLSTSADFERLWDDSYQAFAAACNFFEAYIADTGEVPDSISYGKNHSDQYDSFSSTESNDNKGVGDRKLRRIYAMFSPLKRRLDNAGLSAVVSYISERSINYRNHEYMIRSQQRISL